MRAFQVFIWVGIIALLPFMVFSQPSSGGGGWCSTNNYSRIFNPATIEQLNGMVVRIEKITHEKGMSKGVLLILKTDKPQDIAVHLGPEWYLENQDLQFVVGDIVLVKGSRVSYEKTPAIIAMTVKKEGQMLTLRDKKGTPNWNGWRQGKGMNRNGGGGRKMRMRN